MCWIWATRRTMARPPFIRRGSRMSCCGARWADSSSCRSGPELKQILQPVVEHPEHQRRPAQQRTARKAAVRNCREHVEAFSRTGDGLGHEFARDAGQSESLAREALQEIDNRRKTPEMRRAIDRDVDVSAPGVLDLQ